jgi:uncharacterized membrane protein YfcA
MSRATRRWRIALLIAAAVGATVSTFTDRFGLWIPLALIALGFYVLWRGKRDLDREAAS